MLLSTPGTIESFLFNELNKSITLLHISSSTTKSLLLLLLIMFVNLDSIVLVIFFTFNDTSNSLNISSKYFAKLSQRFCMFFSSFKTTRIIGVKLS